LRLDGEPRALDDLATAVTWSQRQAAAVVDAMEIIEMGWWSLGRETLTPNLRFWPVAPLAVLYRVEHDALVVVHVLDRRRLRARP
jgi:hypothetical protein